MSQEEDEACGFLHIGSGWPKNSVQKTSRDKHLSSEENHQTKDQGMMKQPTALWTELPPLDVVQLKAFKNDSRVSQERGCNRAMPYPGRSTMRERNAEAPHMQGKEGTVSIVRKRNNSIQLSSDNRKQSDFENLSLGPGCPWSDAAMDLHI